MRITLERRKVAGTVAKKAREIVHVGVIDRAALERDAPLPDRGRDEVGLELGRDQRVPFAILAHARKLAAELDRPAEVHDAGRVRDPDEVLVAGKRGPGLDLAVADLADVGRVGNVGAAGGVRLAGERKGRGAQDHAHPHRLPPLVDSGRPLRHSGRLDRLLKPRGATRASAGPSVAGLSQPRSNLAQGARPQLRIIRN